MKVYTKSGDKGTTSLIGGQRISKCSERVEAYGTVDELTAFIGLLGDKLKTEESTAAYTEELYRINSMLMNVEAHLAAGENIDFKLPEITDEAIKLLEDGIDRMQAQVPAIASFTLPGGHEIISLCHVCRTICRRAERRSIAVAELFELDTKVLCYLNRLSDYLYLLGRVSTKLLCVDEILWRR
ncbi:MAG: cob(I)yrinic acid a,c-diamide adenosyltransferase [Rikenellaceae bacterium]